MIRRRILALCVPGLVAMTLFSGCAGSEEFPEPPPERRVKASKKKSGDLPEVAAPTDGVVKGRVVLVGDAPKIEIIQAMAGHNDKDVCLAPDADETEKIAQQWILSTDKKGVANVVVRLAPPKGQKFKAIAPKETEVEVDQPHCAFKPHVVALAPGQRLLVKNSAPVPHNIKMTVDPASGNVNKSIVIQPKSQLAAMELNYQKKPIDIACDFHSWMTGKVYLSDHPYIAVTDKNGEFTIKNVPIGVPLKVEAIHEAGTVVGDGVEQTFKAGDNVLDLKVQPK